MARQAHTRQVGCRLISPTQRLALLQHLRGLLTQGGKLVLTTLCRGRDPSICALSLWSAMTEGCDPVPEASAVASLLSEAGFAAVKTETLLPDYHLFTANRG